MKKKRKNEEKITLEGGLFRSKTFILSSATARNGQVKNRIHQLLKENIDKKYPIWNEKETEIHLNELLMLRLEKGKSNIYVDGKLFSQCKYLLLNIPKERLIMEEMKEIDSIDEAERYLDKRLESRITREIQIDSEQEFFAHASNLQAWVEHDYDTRILHRNLAFPLLKALADAGDKRALQRFKEEIIIRANSSQRVFEYLLQEGYFGYLSGEEMTILSPKFSMDKFSFAEINSFAPFFCGKPYALSLSLEDKKKGLLGSKCIFYPFKDVKVGLNRLRDEFSVYKHKRETLGDPVLLDSLLSESIFYIMKRIPIEYRHCLLSGHNYGDISPRSIPRSLRDFSGGVVISCRIDMKYLRKVNFQEFFEYARPYTSYFSKFKDLKEYVKHYIEKYGEGMTYFKFLEEEKRKKNRETHKTLDEFTRPLILRQEKYNPFSRDALKKMRTTIKDTTRREKGGILFYNPKDERIECGEIMKGGYSHIDYEGSTSPPHHWIQVGSFHTHPIERDLYTAFFSYSDWINGFGGGYIQCIGGNNEKGENVLNCYDFGDDLGFSEQSEEFIEKVNERIRHLKNPQYFGFDEKIRKMFDKYKIYSEVGF